MSYGGPAIDVDFHAERGGEMSVPRMGHRAGDTVVLSDAESGQVVASVVAAPDGRRGMTVRLWWDTWVPYAYVALREGT